MKFNHAAKLVAMALAINCLASCGSKDSDEPSQNVDNFTESSKCPPQNTLKSLPPQSFDSEVEKTTQAASDFYLSSEEIFYLEEKVYNFANIYIENGALLTISDQAEHGINKIEINASGSCEFYGDIQLANYEGALEISCYSFVLNISNFNAPNLTDFSVSAGTGEIVLEGVHSDQNGEISSDSSVTLGASSLDVTSIPTIDIDGNVTFDVSGFEVNSDQEPIAANFDLCAQ